MDAPELTNFGSLIRHALELEAAIAAFYEAATRVAISPTATSLMRELAGQHSNRRTLLERMRQQKLNEMVLEPIWDLDGARYAFDAALPDSSVLDRKARELEALSARFYRESSEVARSLLAEATRTLRKMADENDRNAARV